MNLFLHSHFSSAICLTIFWINLVEIFFIGFLPMMYRAIMGRTSQKRTGELFNNCIIIVALLSALLHKPHNVLLVGALLATSRFVAERIDRIADDKHCSILLKVITHYWLGKTFYFYQVSFSETLKRNIINLYTSIRRVTPTVWPPSISTPAMWD